MDKLDLTKLYKNYYSASTTPQLIDFTEEGSYITITHQGSPDSAHFTNAVEALYTVGYAVKAIWKKQGRDFTVAKLEGLWWVDSDEDALDVPREQWRWKLMIRLPAYVTANDVEEARVVAAAKKEQLGVLLALLTFDTMKEGPSVQMLHVGPYATEPETLGQMHQYMKERGWVQGGLHHEIYLSDPRKSDPSTMSTILRLPVQLVAAR